MDRSRLASLVHDMIAVSRERQLSVKSAGLAYHAFNTLVPLVILALVAVTATDSLEVVFDTFETATGLDTAATQSALEDVIGDGGGRLGAAVLALVIFLWSAVRMFQATNSAFTGVYGSRKRQSYLTSIVNVALLTLTVTLAIVLVAVVGVSLSLVVEGIWWRLISPLLLLALLVGAFLPTYYLFPEADVSVREVLPGTVFTAITWTALAVSFRLYIVISDSVELFGIAGGVLIVLTWVYLGGLCVLTGAVLNAVLAGRVDPDDGWVPVVDAVSSDAAD
ncbi:YihY/virulence factor BrkB family protein [Natrononativus amylolyticus]|uniref:YihY/virulence factor BrkB family protein n=1 Tax=Natrononativus amylolyticus TaxID=2963434 RepID=UPI0020CC080B|nr:YihY/virulence factor BrkB family protein [Natrononativus amylolyticus]